VSMRPVVAAAAVLLLAAAPALADDADEARETFNSLFAKDLEAVQETGTRTDDVALARRLVETAGKSTGSPAFLSLLCEHACRLASGHPTGYATAIRAMELVAKHVPAKADEARERLLDLRRKQFEAAQGEARRAAGDALLDALLVRARAQEEAGDTTAAAGLYREARTVAKAVGSDRLPAIEESAEALARRIRLARRIEDVKAILQKHPDNVGAREGLVRLYLVNLNEPAKAAEVLEGVKDADLKKYVPAAARPVEEAPELACLQLGEWYRELAETAPDYAKANMYARAKAYLDRFLTLHETKDLKRTRGKVALEKVTEAMEDLEAAATAKAQPAKPAKPTETAGGIEKGVIKPGQWVDLLSLVDPQKDTVKGGWQKKEGGLSIEQTPPWACIKVPVVTNGSYELDVRFVRTSGDESLGVFLPVGSSRVLLEFSILKGKAGGFNVIGGKPAPENEAAVKPCALENGHEYRVHVQTRVRGETAKITVTLDGKPWTSWEGRHSSLSVFHDWGMPQPKTFGFSAWCVGVSFRSARLKMLSGEARVFPRDR